MSGLAPGRHGGTSPFLNMACFDPPPLIPRLSAPFVRPESNAAALSPAFRPRISRGRGIDYGRVELAVQVTVAIVEICLDETPP